MARVFSVLQKKSSFRWAPKKHLITLTSNSLFLSKRLAALPNQWAQTK